MYCQWLGLNFFIVLIDSNYLLPETKSSSTIPLKDSASPTPSLPATFHTPPSEQAQTCPRCQNLAPDQQCIWLLKVTNQPVDHLIGSAITFAAEDEQLPPLVIFYIFSAHLSTDTTLFRKPRRASETALLHYTIHQHI